MADELLPLFPLEVVLFPGVRLPLHIFEPRYKQMIGRCLERQEQFGVTRARRDGIARVGCTADIVEVVKRYEDGRLDILTVGRSRFRIVELADSQAYLQAKAELVPDEKTGEEAAEADRLRQVYGELLALVPDREPAPAGPAADAPLSYQIAGKLPLELDFKQQLLELLSEAARQRSLAEHLEEWLRKLQLTRRARKKSGGNGRGR